MLRRAGIIFIYRSGSNKKRLNSMYEYMGFILRKSPGCRKLKIASPPAPVWITSVVPGHSRFCSRECTMHFKNKDDRTSILLVRTEARGVEVRSDEVSRVEACR